MEWQKLPFGCFIETMTAFSTRGLRAYRQMTQAGRLLAREYSTYVEVFINAEADLREGRAGKGLAAFGPRLAAEAAVPDEAFDGLSHDLFPGSLDARKSPISHARSAALAHASLLLGRKKGFPEGVDAEYFKAHRNVSFGIAMRNGIEFEALGGGGDLGGPAGLF